MKRKHCVGVTRAAAASIMACLALLCLPAVSFAAAPSDSRAEAANSASALLARGAGYGKPQGEPRVRALQRRLRALGHRPGPVDGLYGPLTEAAVERLQRDTGLSADGIVGPQTRRVLNTETPPLAPGAGYGEPGGSSQVRDVQRRLRAAGQRPGPVDGRYGPRTRAAIERFQGTALQEFHRPAFHRQRFDRLDELDGQFQGWIRRYNTHRRNHGDFMRGRTPQIVLNSHR